jgi:hypothetical protein
LLALTGFQSEKTSIRASCRAGCIDLEAEPWLVNDAIFELRHGDGFEGFCKRYGDYYLAGYRLGADTGMLLSSSASSHKKVDNFSITAKAKVLGIGPSITWEKSFQQFREDRLIKLLGYDTLEGRNWKNADSGGDADRELDNWLQGKPRFDAGTLKADAEAIIQRSESLIERVNGVLEIHKVKNGGFLTFKQCEALCEAGVVVELLLLPMARLRDVLKWQYHDDIV